MKKLLLAGLAVVLCAIAFGSTAQAETVAEESPIPNLNHLATDELHYRTSPTGSYFNFHCTASEDGDALCSATRYFRSPPKEFLIYWCEGHTDDWGRKDKQAGCVLFKRVPGDEWCNSQIRRGGRDATTPGCVWGVDHDYTLVVTLNAVGGVEVGYTSERILNPDTGKGYGRQTGGRIDSECRRKLREMERTGDYGPVPECAGRTYYAD